MSAIGLAALETGAVAGLGPCALSRSLALSALVRARAPRERSILVIEFLAGLVAGYVAFGGVFASFAAVVSSSRIAYVAAAALCAIAGALSAWRAGRTNVPQCSDCIPNHMRGNACAFGAACTLVGSPCCGPLAAAIGAGAVAYGPREAIVLLAFYAIGHAVPAIAVFLAGEKAAALTNALSSRAVESISAGLLFGLSGYYAILA
jgi:cytochrome c biogenesis protein CcdA